jgi:putative phosphoesterase
VTSKGQGRTTIGVISDTHGHLDPVVLELFAGVDHIIHAGDVIDVETLRALEGVAPVTVVPGNLDTGKLARQPREVTGAAGPVLFAVGHKRKRLLKKLVAGRIEGIPAGRQPDLVVFGHDHIPAAEWVDGTLYLNPGTAASPHEEDDDPTIAIVSVEPTGLSVTFVPLVRSEEALTG